VELVFGILVLILGLMASAILAESFWMAYKYLSLASFTLDDPFRLTWNSKTSILMQLDGHKSQIEFIYPFYPSRMNRKNQPASQTISLLWPETGPQATVESRLDQQAIRDLDLENTVLAFILPQEQRAFVAQVLNQLCDDPDVIRYRQDVLEDLLNYPKFYERLEGLLPTLEQLSSHRWANRELSGLFEVTFRLGELENYVICVEELNKAFGEMEGDLQSAAWQRLRDQVATIKQDENFKNLVVELPGLMAQVRTIASITIGINLDAQLYPCGATLVSVNKEKFTSPSLLKKIFRKNARQWEGITQLRTPPPKKDLAGYDMDPDLYGWAVDPKMVPLFKDLAQISDQVSVPVAKALKAYIEVNGERLLNLGNELAFFLSAVKLIRRLQDAGMPTCKPEITPKEDRICEVEEGYNISLALRMDRERGQKSLRGIVITNSIRMGDQGRILILTGPNQGGKTIHTQAIGLIHVFAQAGLQIPGEQAHISPVDGIYTHFPVEERPKSEAGRLGEESQRLHNILSKATRHSLILFNESLTSTSPGESLYLARDIVRVLKMMETRAIFSTHLHELAASVDELNAEAKSDSQVISLVASLVEEGQPDSPDEVQRSYKIIPNPPIGYSYAQEIAQRHGISYDQLTEMLKERGVVH
jgi:DNA mismatch repair protein MutS